MDIYEIRKNKGRKILFNKDDGCLLGLDDQLKRSSHLLNALWAMDLARELTQEFSLDPEYPFLLESYESVYDWLLGNRKMSKARPYILKIHRLANDKDQKRYYLFHAIAQAFSVIHTPKHALGLPLYELSYYYSNQKDYLSCIAYYQKKLSDLSYDERLKSDKWASFVLK